jgi:Dolichyl-phosphate-mannose-protein mannosyltransferase
VRSDDRVPRALALGVFLLHAACANRYGFFRDELYYIACGQHLSAGYVDHPPLIAFLARVTEVVGGGSLVAFRLVAAAAAAALVLLTARLARELGGGNSAQALAALAIAAAPVMAALGTLFTMNAFEPLFWTGVAILVVRAIRDDEAKGLVWLGPVVGFGLLDKHSVAWLVVALALGLLLTPARKLLVRRPVAIAAGIAALIALPNVIWEAMRHFPTLEFMKNAQRFKNLTGSPLALVKDLVLSMNPLAAPIWLGGLVALFFQRELRQCRALGWAFLAIFALVASQHGKSYYLAPALPFLVAAGAVAAERWLARAFLRRSAYALLAVSGAVLMPLAIPILPARRVPEYMDALGIEPPRTERHEPAALPQHFADQFGWPELENHVAATVATLSPSERQNAVIFAGNYGEASAIAWYGRGKGLPPVASGHNSYFLWGPPSDDRRTVIVVGVERAVVETFCASVEERPRGLHPLAMPYENEAPILVCRELMVPWTELWPRVKRFI